MKLIRKLKNIKIKICGITNPKTLDYCIGLNVDFFGLIFFNKSPRNINIKKATELVNYQNNLKCIPVGVFVNQKLEKLIEIIKKTNLKHVQLHGNESNEYICKLKNKCNLKVIKAIGVQKNNDLNLVKDYSNADLFLFDYKPKKEELPGGNAKSFNWSILKNINISKPWLIAGGINKNNVNDILENLLPYGIDISSGVEDAPGIKSLKKIKEIVNIIND